MLTPATLRHSRLFAKSLVLALVAVIGLSAAAKPVEAAKKNYKTYFVVFVKYPEKQEVWQTFKYTSKKAADKKADQLNNEHWVKVSPVVGKPKIVDGEDHYVGHQIAGLPDKIFAGLTGVNVAKIELIEKEACVRVRYEEIK